MVSYRAVTCSVVASLFMWIGQASAGWIIDQVAKGSGEGSRQQVVLQANLMKTLTFGKDGQPAEAFILDLNAQTITQVDYRKRHYVTATVQEYARMIRDAYQAASEHMARRMQEIQEAIKEMPPEQQKMVEEMLRSQVPQGEPARQDCPEPGIELKKTNDQATIAGYPTVRYDVLIDGKLDSELWLAKGITVWRELDPQKLERFSAELAKLAPPCRRAKGRHRLGGDDPAWKVASEGYPVRRVRRGGGTSTVEVVKAESGSVPATEFQPPADFARKSLR